MKKRMFQYDTTAENKMRVQTFPFLKYCSRDLPKSVMKLMGNVNDIENEEHKILLCDNCR